MSIVCTFILEFYLNTLHMNKVGECCLPSVVRMQYFSIIFKEKKCTLYSILLNVVEFNVILLIVAAPSSGQKCSKTQTLIFKSFQAFLKPYFIDYSAHFVSLKMMLKYCLRTVLGRQHSPTLFINKVFRQKCKLKVRTILACTL